MKTNTKFPMMKLAKILVVVALAAKPMAALAADADGNPAPAIHHVERTAAAHRVALTAPVPTHPAMTLRADPATILDPALRFNAVDGQPIR